MAAATPLLWPDVETRWPTPSSRQTLRALASSTPRVAAGLVASAPMENRATSWIAAPPDKGPLVDERVRDHAITMLSNISSKRAAGQEDRPFFIAVGFHKPHLPEYCPSRYWDMYEPESLTLAANPNSPSNAPQIAVQTSALWRKWFNLSSQVLEPLLSPAG